MSNNNKFGFVIKNKKLFVFSIILLAIIMFLDAVGVSPDNEYLDALTELGALFGIITMMFLSVKHNTIINTAYIFFVFVCVMLIIIACLSYFKSI